MHLSSGCQDATWQGERAVRGSLERGGRWGAEVIERGGRWGLEVVGVVGCCCRRRGRHEIRRLALAWSAARGKELRRAGEGDAGEGGARGRQRELADEGLDAGEEEEERRGVARGGIHAEAELARQREEGEDRCGGMRAEAELARRRGEGHTAERGWACEGGARAAARGRTHGDRARSTA